MSCAWTEGVACDGEVFFDVARDSLRPFRVETAGNVVKVLGTRFDIRHYEEEQLRHVVKQVLNGLQWLHNRFVVHGVVVCNRGQFVEHPARQSVLDAGG